MNYLGSAFSYAGQMQVIPTLQQLIACEMLAAKK